MKIHLQYVYILCFTLIAVYPSVTESARILGIFPLAGKSHFTCHHAILKSLIEAGHQVTVITPFPEHAAQANYTSIIDVSAGQTILINRTPHTDFAKPTIGEFLEFIINNMKKPMCYAVTNHPEIQKILKTGEKLYDVVFVEILYLYDCLLPVAEKMGVPVIGTITFRSWLLTDRSIGNPNNPAYIPVELGKDMNWDPTSFFCRLRNLWYLISVEWYRNFHIRPFLRKFHQQHIDLFGPEGKFIDMKPALVFYNDHFSLLSRPMNPNAISIGGIHIEEAKPLPEELKRFIDEAEHGVIFLSFGSITRFSLFPVHIQNAFRDAFAEIPQRVIWKYEDEMANLTNNVKLLEWLPQRDILEHKNVKAFISHCGQGGINEAVHTGTPVIGIPLFADQHAAAAVLKLRQVAVLLDIDNISKEKILIALNTIINDTSYNNNMQKLSTLFKDRPMTPQQSVVYWTEYVIKHNGAPHLETAAARMNFFQYLLLDVLFFIVSCVILILSILCYFFKAIGSCRLWAFCNKIKSE